jgi:hypothetical protein
MNPTNKVSRNHLSQAYENIYLRVNILRRTLNKFSSDQITAILSDPEFQKCCTYMATRTFLRSKDFLTSYGFELEDIISISQIFGLNFQSCKTKTKTKRDRNYIMMRYIGQRFHSLLGWSERKFGNPDNFRSIEMQGTSGDDTYDVTDLMVGAQYATDTGPYTLETHDSLSDKISAVTEKIKRIDGILSTGKTLELLEEKMDLMGKKQYLQNELDETEPPGRYDLGSSANDLKKRLDANWEKHQESLAHYATTAYTTNDVRRKARAYCEKYGIDYLSWAKTKLSNGKMSAKDVVLR